jgi:hypothetical protein
MSKFDKIFEARETETVKEKENGNKEPAIKNTVETKKDAGKVKRATLDVSDPITRLTGQTNTKRGRPPAKRSDPNFVGLTTYVRRDTHMRAKIALLQEGKGRELSQLVEDLIYSWLNKK